MHRILIHIVLALCIVLGLTAQENKSVKIRNVAIFVYDGVDILDLAAPGEIFSNVVIQTTDRNKYKVFNVYLVSLDNKHVKSKGFLSINPNFTVFDCPKPDIVVIPGGEIESMVNNYKFNKWLKYSTPQCCSIIGIGTGTYALANAGLLDDHHAAVWDGADEVFKKAFPNVKLDHNVIFTESENMYTTAGSAGSIELCLHVVRKLYGRYAASNVAEYINYRSWNDSSDLFKK